jgi:hypothetical protein
MELPATTKKLINYIVKYINPKKSFLLSDHNKFLETVGIRAFAI